MSQIINGATDDSLIIYIHRGETDRFASAIKQVGKDVCLDAKLLENPHNSNVYWVQQKCIIKEESFLFDLIATQTLDIGYGNQLVIMPCSTYELIKQQKPKMVLVLNYKQADKLQSIIAKHHCPELLQGDTLPIRENVGLPKILEYS